MSNEKELATPPWTTLRKLESASLAFERNDDGMEEKWLKQLKNWQKLAKKYGLSRGDMERMAPAFDMEYKG
ncbi:MAG: hypothetical protein ACI4DN_05815 [Lachnospiraceae bacterium]